MLKIMKASAGSGKTYSLARTYIRILLGNADRYTYRHILAVTFTNKATDEMKSRILKELYILSTDPGSSDYHDDFVPSLFADDASIKEKAGRVLHDILHDYSAFAVSTIDRFFQQTLKAFSREIGQFSSYQVELDKDSLVAESVDRILDSLSENDSDLLEWLTRNVLEQIEQGGRYNTDANLMEMALRLKSQQRQDVMEKAGIDEDAVCSQENLMQIRQSCRQIKDSFRMAVMERARRALAVLTEAGVDVADSNRGFLKCLPGYAELGEHDDISRPSDSFLSKAPDHEMWFAKSKAKKLLPLVYPFLEAPLEDFTALWGRDYDVYNTACILDGQIYGLGVAGELTKAYKEIMKEKNVLSIDDSNTILKGIIDGSDAPFVYEKTGVRFDHFLLDEFQDTSSVQWTNFSPLLHNSNAQGGENLVVGDVKQSIYRWRGSDWKLLDRTVPDEFPEYKEEVLDTNYRSLSNVVEFNNAYFAAVAGVIDGFGGNPEGGPVSQIYADVVQSVAKKDKEPGSVSVTFCTKDAELQMVLDSIMEVRAAGGLLSEITVLVRSNAIGENVSKFLIENGVDVITDDSLKVKSAVTVRRLVSLMSYVDNPENTVNGYLADSLDIILPESSISLIDMAEALIRNLKENDQDGVWMGEVLYLQSFMDCLQDYVSINGNNLRGFLKYWDKEDPSISSPASGESVRVMTIHKSKGLDFPYVIIPFAENIRLFKADSMWCAPELKDTALEGVAEGVYDVLLSKSAEHSLFSSHYRNENFLQQVDNMNTIYVAMTRAALGMHIIAQMPSSKCLKALDDDDMSSFADFSQILYWFMKYSGRLGGVRMTSDEEQVRFDLGNLVDFASFRKTKDNGELGFNVDHGKEYPSFPLAQDMREDVAESLDFFSEDGLAGMAASNRIKGIILHDILADIAVPSDLQGAVSKALMSGDITPEEAEEIKDLLSVRIAEASSKGWFPDDASKVLNETSIIDVDGKVYRPDRVVKDGNGVIIIDYKFGEHDRKYERQISRYSDMWKRMGYENVTSILWYVHTGECVII